MSESRIKQNNYISFFLIRNQVNKLLHMLSEFFKTIYIGISETIRDRETVKKLNIYKKHYILYIEN